MGQPQVSVQDLWTVVHHFQMLHLAVSAGTQTGGPRGGPSTTPTAVGRSDSFIFSLTGTALTAQPHAL